MIPNRTLILHFVSKSLRPKRITVASHPHLFISTIHSLPIPPAFSDGNSGQLLQSLTHQVRIGFDRPLYCRLHSRSSSLLALQGRFSRRYPLLFFFLMPSLFLRLPFSAPHHNSPRYLLVSPFLMLRSD